jgi:hypothetical protein
VKRRHPWRRHFRTLGICLLLGVVLTVGVAWAALLVGNRWHKGVVNCSWQRVPTSQPPFRAWDCFHKWGCHATRLFPDNDNQTIYFAIDAGVPVSSLACTTRQGYANAGWVTADADHAFLVPSRLSGPSTLQDRLPALPLWPGFAIDVAFYAGLSWLLFFAPFTLRRAIRARRGRCCACGYDMRGLDV